MRASRRTDAVVAVALAAFSVAQVLIFPIAPRAIGVAIALASTLPIAVRRDHPVAALIAGTAAWLVPTDGYLIVGYVAVFLLLYSFAVSVDDLRLVAIAPVVLFGVSLFPLLRNDEPIGEWLGTVLAVAAPVAVGRFVRRERERTSRMSVAEERARIARELHDVVAHGVSVIAVQADAAEAALAHDPDRAAKPLAAIRGSAHDALAEMRRMVGVLGETHERGPRRRCAASAARRTTRWPRCAGWSACSGRRQSAVRSPDSRSCPGCSRSRARRWRSAASRWRCRRHSTSPRTGSSKRR